MSAIGKIIGGALLIAVGAFTGAGFLIQAGASLLISGIGTLLSKGPATTPNASQRNPIAPWNVVYGRARVGGTIVYIEENGDTNKYLHQVIVLACHPCQAVDSLLFNNQRVVLDANGNSISFGDSTAVIGHQQSQNIASINRTNDVVTVTLTAPLPPPAGQGTGFITVVTGDQLKVQNVGVDRTLNGTWTVTVISPTVLTYISGGNPVTVTNQGQIYTLYPDYGDTVHMEVLLGNHTSTFPTLLAESNGLWTSQHLLLGRTSVYLRLKYGGQTYANGLPTIAFTVRGKNNILDPRTNTTGYTENAALIIADYLANTTFGFKATYGTEIPLEPLMAAANICDEAVPIAVGGSEPRYACNGQFPLTVKRGEMLQNLLTACAGRLTYAGGSFVIHPGIWAGPANVIAQGIQFTGLDYIDFGTLQTLYVQSDWSVGLWVFLAANAHGNLVSMLNAGDSANYALGAACYVLSVRSGASDANGNPQFGLEYVHDNNQGHEYLYSPSSTVPANRWVYVGASRNSAAKTVTFYWGDGTNVYSLGSASYSNMPGVTGGQAHLTLGAFWYENFSNTPANSDFYPAISQMASAFMWAGNLAQADHAAAMSGQPSQSGLLLDVTDLTTNPVISNSPVTGTLQGFVHGGITVPGAGSMANLTGLQSTAGPFTWRPKVSVRDLYNGVKGTYVSPANNWQSSDFPPYAQDVLHGYASDVNQAADGGDRRWLDVQLPFTISTSTAQRLAKIELLRRRQQGSGTFTYNLTMYQTAVLDVISYTFPTLNWSGKLLEITGHRFTLNKQTVEGQDVTLLGTELDLNETSSTIYDWSTSEELTPQGFSQAALPSTSDPAAPTGVTAVSSAATAVTGADGIVRSRISVAWTTPADGYVLNGGSIQVQYQLVGAAAWVGLPAVDPSVTSAYIDGVTDGAQYKVQVRSVNAAGTPSSWVAAGPVTVSNANSQLPYGSITGVPVYTVNGT